MLNQDISILFQVGFSPQEKTLLLVKHSSYVVRNKSGFVMIKIYKENIQSKLQVLPTSVSKFEAINL